MNVESPSNKVGTHSEGQNWLTCLHIPCRLPGQLKIASVYAAFSKRIFSTRIFSLLDSLGREFLRLDVTTVKGSRIAPSREASDRLNLPLGESVVGDDSVADVDHAVGVFGDVVLVRDQHDGVALLVQVIHQRHNFIPSLGIEVSRGFVR